MRKGSKGKNITVSTNYTQLSQNGTPHITDAVGDYDTETCLPFFSSSSKHRILSDNILCALKQD